MKENLFKTIYLILIGIFLICFTYNLLSIPIGILLTINYLVSAVYLMISITFATVRVKIRKDMEIKSLLTLFILVPLLASLGHQFSILSFIYEIGRLFAVITHIGIIFTIALYSLKLRNQLNKKIRSN